MPARLLRLSRQRTVLISANPGGGARSINSCWATGLSGDESRRVIAEHNA